MPTAVGTEYLELDDYPLSNYAVRISDLTALWVVAYRAEVLDAPYVHGGLSFPQYLAAPSVVLPGFVVGEVSSTGSATSGRRAGLAANLDELYTAVLAPVTSGDGTRAAEWHRADSTTWTADVQVSAFDIRSHDQDNGRMDFSLTLTIVSGRFVAP